MKSMTDEACVQAYASTLAKLWKTKYKKMGPIGGHDTGPLTEMINDVLQSCGVPKILSFAPLDRNDSRQGCFISALWSINLNYYKMSSLELSAVNNFLNLAETLYHEGRHAEQHWLVVCMASATIRKIDKEGSRDSNSMKKLVTNLSVLPRYITEKAWLAGETFCPTPELRQKIIGWYDSMYANRYDHKLYMDKAYKNPLLDDMTWMPEVLGAFAPYRHSAHEADAFSIGGLAYKKLGDILDKMGEITDLIDFQDPKSVLHRPVPKIPKRPSNWGNCCNSVPPQIPPRAGGRDLIGF